MSTSFQDRLFLCPDLKKRVIEGIRTGCSSLKFSSYVSFLRKYRYTLRLIEDILPRLILHASASYHHDINYDCSPTKHSRILSFVGRSETLYAFLNLWTLLNDSLFYGLEGNRGSGLTVGKIPKISFFQNRPDSPSSVNEGQNLRNCSMYPFTHDNAYAITTILLRSALSVLQCLTPVLEIASAPTLILDSRAIAEGSLRTTSTQNELHDISINPKSTSNTNILLAIEKFRFICRLGLLLLARYGNNNKKEQNRCEHNNGKNIPECKHTHDRGILQRGGGLSPREIPISTSHEEKRLLLITYIGRRTGRKIVGKNEIAATIRKEEQFRSIHSNSKSLLKKKQELYFATFEKEQIFNFIIDIGEIMYAYRPLQWIKFKRCSANETLLKPNQLKQGVVSLRSWFACFVMDILSQWLIHVGYTLGCGIKVGSKVRNMDLRSPLTIQEMMRRKLRCILYLLREPVWEHFTCPIVKSVSHYISQIPIFGVSLTNYFTDLLLYWKQWHFMLED
mmetsp:Transcript_21705/g.30432  ORF Transcript_21705/g.30432 Transcript_21705/m.30432 type:complete len:507 (-) Transcript_21705:72-1592(-)